MKHKVLTGQDGARHKMIKIYSTQITAGVGLLGELIINGAETSLGLLFALGVIYTMIHNSIAEFLPLIQTKRSKE